MKKMTFKIKGTHCKSCKMLITDVLEDEGVKIISFDIDEKKQLGKITLETDLHEEEIIKAIESEGDYDVTKV